MTSTVDVIVIGSGINGLVASAELAKAGCSVALIERNDRLGGFIATEERTVPGYLHDTYSSWHPLFLSGPAYAALGPDLHRHGLEYRNTDGLVTASVAQDGRVTVAHRDPEATAAEFEHPADRTAYLAALQRFLANAEPIGDLIGSELRSLGVVRRALRMLRANGRSGTEAWLRDVGTSGRSFCRRTFEGGEVDHLWSPWLLHAGLSPDHASGGFMLPILAATLHGFGVPVVAGGSGQFITAFERLLAEERVSVHTGTRVEHIIIDGGRAVGVVANGKVIRARRTILASVAPQALYGGMLPASVVSTALRNTARSYRPGRAGMQIHVALSAPLTWTDQRLAHVPLLHISDGSSTTGIACTEAEAGLLPRQPTVVVGQQSLLDPSRVPAGAGALWIQLQEVPFRPLGDAAGHLEADGEWNTDLARAYSARVLDRIAAHAPDLQSKVVAVDVVAPTDLASYNPNAIAGDPYGGSAELDQNFLWRPFPAGASHRTVVPGLWHIGASTHPGPGLSGGSGHLVAQTLLTTARRLRRMA
ncbi:phytoene desaturase family protein [Kribbella sp. NPDC051620]|uniref:phytoene desaturase family protein n=1 Tax=Kribbella sp. NPDC051620 TaxID=3364120 RepID=UPI0037A20E28